MAQAPPSDPGDGHDDAWLEALLKDKSDFTMTFHDSHHPDDDDDDDNVDKDNKVGSDATRKPSKHPVTLAKRGADQLYVEESMLNLETDISHIDVDALYANLLAWSALPIPQLLPLLKCLNSFPMADLFRPDDRWKALHGAIYAMVSRFAKEKEIWQILLSFLARMLLSHHIPLEENMAPVIDYIAGHLEEPVLVPAAHHKVISLLDTAWQCHLYFTRILLKYLSMMCAASWSSASLQERERLIRVTADLCLTSHSQSKYTMGDLALLLDPGAHLLRDMLRHRSHWRWLPPALVARHKSGVWPEIRHQHALQTPSARHALQIPMTHLTHLREQRQKLLRHDDRQLML